MTSTTLDLVIIGGGPGGYGAALYAASAGLSVALVEKDTVGGTCLNRGCIPAKAMLESAAVLRKTLDAEQFGVVCGSPTIDFSKVQDRKQRLVSGIVTGLSNLLTNKKNLSLFTGTGTLLRAGVVSVRASDGSLLEVESAAVVLAPGSAPHSIPGFEPSAAGPVYTSDEALDFRSIPDRIAIIGGGVVGVEFASLFADVGAEVTILESQDAILPSVDREISDIVARALKRRRVDARTATHVTGHSPRASGGTTIHLDGHADLEVDAVIVCVGRRPATRNVANTDSGVTIDKGEFIEVDALCRTAASGVYAVGDAIDTPQLAHVAYAEAVVAVKGILGEEPLPIDYANVPLAIYSHPEVASVGYTEDAAIALGYDVLVARQSFRTASRAQIVGETEGAVKVIARKQPDGTAGEVLGVHMCGPWVTEQLSGAYLALNWQATVDEIANLVQPHPTFTELFGETVLSLTGRHLNA